MSKVLVTDQSIEDIATALRSKLKTGKSYKVSEMAAAVTSIKTEDSVVLGTKTITESGTYDPEDDNLDGYSSVVVDVSSTLTPASGVSF